MLILLRKVLIQRMRWVEQASNLLIKQKKRSCRLKLFANF